MFKVNAELFRIAHSFVSTEETRYYLQGVCIEPHQAGGVTMTSTDGQRLLCVYDEAGSCDKPEIVKLGKTELKACAPDRRETTRVLEGDDRTVPAWISSEDGRQIMPCHDWHVDGTFPDWRRILPSTKTLESTTAAVSFNAAYMADFQAIAQTLAKMRGAWDWKAAPITLHPGPGDAPMLVNIPNAPHVFGILMPVRHGAEDVGLPWFIRVEQAQEHREKQAAE